MKHEFDKVVALMKEYGLSMEELVTHKDFTGFSPHTVNVVEAAVVKETALLKGIKYWAEDTL